MKPKKSYNRKIRIKSHRNLSTDVRVHEPAGEHHVEGEGVVVEQAALASLVDEVADADGGKAPTD